MAYRPDMIAQNQPSAPLRWAGAEKDSGANGPEWRRGGKTLHEEHS